MSDQSQGPGWFQASDGKWYPSTPPTAPVSVPRSKPFYRKWWVITLAVVVVLLIIGALSGGSKKKTVSTTAATTTTRSSSSSSATTTTSTTVPTTTTVAGPHAVGDSAHTGDFDVTVNAVSEPYVARNQFEQAHAGEHYVAIDVSMKNTAKEAKTLSTAFFDLTDPEGRKYSETYLDNNQPIDGDVPPGEPRRGMLFYTVPDGVTGLVLRVRGDFTSGGTTFQIN